METLFLSAQFHRGYETADELNGFWNGIPKNAPFPGMAFIGRSNVGKSSLINALFNHKIAHVSNTPGRTQQINIFTFILKSKIKNDEGAKAEKRQFYCFDLPGYGHAKVSKEVKQRWQELIDAFFKKVPQEVALVNIQDARHPFGEADEVFFEYLKTFKLRPILVLNKMDKLKTQKERAQLNNSKNELFAKTKAAKQVYFTSTTDKQGMEELQMGLYSHLGKFN